MLNNKKMNKVFFAFLKGSLALSIVIPVNGVIHPIAKQQSDKELKSILEVSTRNEDYFKYYHEDDTVRVIIELEEPAAIEKESRSNIPSEAMVDQVIAEQKDVKKEVEMITGEKTNNQFGTLINGFSIDSRVKEINELEKVDGVKRVKVAKTYYPSMNSAKELTQAIQAWEHYSLKGNGMVVSIIDSGIDPSHKDMRLTDSSSMKLNQGNLKEGPGKFYSNKIPYGYNFADKNDNIIDTNPSTGMHGMHVAGIVGANGKQEEVDKHLAIQGVAPEAQLLAMKVFTNNPNESGAKEDDIVAAIEESVVQGADVINMSLGSNAGFQDENDPEQIAIKKAVDAGVVVVVAAGNAQYSTAPYKLPNIKDTGVVGAPGTAKDALTVANYHNRSIVLPVIQYNKDQQKQIIPYMLSGNEKDMNYNQLTDIVDAKLGKPEDFTSVSVSGKIALVKRGELAFTDKAKNAQKAGAVGIIIYNQDGDDSFISMSHDEEITIPYVFIRNRDGIALQEAAIQATKIQFTKELTQLDSENKGDFVESSSWGPTPSLDFKPQVSAPGGNIFSTLNGNQYGMMTGTSMAAPHVAGAEALVVEGLKKKYPSLKGRELVEFAKKSMISTSKVQMDIHHQNVPYSPRRQGAGLIQIEQAITNHVLIQDESKNATVALKEIGNETNFTLTLKNYGNQPASYTLENIGGVLGETEEQLDTMTYDKPLSGATITFNQKNVVVPAQGSATVQVTLTLSPTVSKNQFVEGFIQFHGNQVPSLSVPFIGFYGDWDEEQIIDGMDFDPSHQKTSFHSSLITNLGGKIGYGVGLASVDESGKLQTDPTKIAISPNGDGNGDLLIPQLYFLRNAKNLEIELLDQNKQSLGVIGSETDIRKQLFLSENGKAAIPFSQLAWNGTILNPETGHVEVLKEGLYYMNIKAKVDLDHAKFQEMIVPVSIDLTAPKIKITSSNQITNESEAEVIDYNLTWKVEDNLAVIPNIASIFVNDQAIKTEIIQKDGEYHATIPLNKNSDNKVSITMSDTAFNEMTTVENIKLEVVSSTIEFKEDVQNQTLSVSDSNEYRFQGKITGKLKEFKINQEDVLVAKDGTFNHKVVLKEGLNDIVVSAIDWNGKVLKNFHVKIIYQKQSSIEEEKNHSLNQHHTSTSIDSNQKAKLETIEYHDNQTQINTKKEKETVQKQSSNTKQKVSNHVKDKGNKKESNSSFMDVISLSIVGIGIFVIIGGFVYWKRKQ